MEEFFIFQKKVDKSVLFQGMAVTTRFQDVFYDKIGFRLQRGESRLISVLIDGIAYKVKLTNQMFDDKKFQHHADMLQIRYDGNRELLELLRQKFSKTWNRLTEYKQKYETYRGFTTSVEMAEYINVYATPVTGTLLIDCIQLTEYMDGIRVAQNMDELTFETSTDEGACIIERYGLRKIRHLSAGIGNSLKEIYRYRCQICGEYIGEKYGSNLIHAHHIDYFTKSLNNDVSNILVVCPNHHGIIHDRNPEFNRETRTYLYPNGYKEGLKLNCHI